MGKISEMSENCRCYYRDCTKPADVPFFMGTIEEIGDPVYWWYCREHSKDLAYPDGCSYWRVG